MTYTLSIVYLNDDRPDVDILNATTSSWGDLASELNKIDSVSDIDWHNLTSDVTSQSDITSMAEVIANINNETLGCDPRLLDIKKGLLQARDDIENGKEVCFFYR